MHKIERFFLDNVQISLVPPLINRQIDPNVGDWANNVPTHDTKNSLLLDSISFTAQECQEFNWAARLLKINPRPENTAGLQPLEKRDILIGPSWWSNQCDRNQTHQRHRHRHHHHPLSTVATFHSTLAIKQNRFVAVTKYWLFYCHHHHFHNHHHFHCHHPDDHHHPNPHIPLLAEYIHWSKAGRQGWDLKPNSDRSNLFVVLINIWVTMMIIMFIICFCSNYWTHTREHILDAQTLCLAPLGHPLLLCISLFLCCCLSTFPSLFTIAWEGGLVWGWVGGGRCCRLFTTKTSLFPATPPPSPLLLPEKSGPRVVRYVWVNILKKLGGRISCKISRREYLGLP